jgi:NAD(P)-dependent dehydrogenase (short-subunit alcohol dehydrogenase family)
VCIAVSLFDLRGTVAVVLGGNSTLGAAIAEGLCDHGASVALVGRNPDTTERARERLAERGRVAAFLADATQRADLERVRDEVLAWGERIDTLFNCPGKNSATPFFELTLAEWDDIMAVNLKSVVLACQVFGRAMVDAGRGGSIVNISSVSADPPLSRVFTYSASKAGVDSVTRFLARELAPHRVRVNAIVPGFFLAEQNRKILDPERRARIFAHTPLGRFGEPRELQGAAVWLASEAASSFVTGALIRVDGGFGAMSI